MRDVEAPLEVVLELGFPIWIGEVNRRAVALDPGEDAALGGGSGRVPPQGAGFREETAIGDEREGDFGGDRLRQSRHGMEITRQPKKTRRRMRVSGC